MGTILDADQISRRSGTLFVHLTLSGTFMTWDKKDKLLLLHIVYEVVCKLMFKIRRKIVKNGQFFCKNFKTWHKLHIFHPSLGNFQNFGEKFISGEEQNPIFDDFPLHFEFAYSGAYCVNVPNDIVIRLNLFAELLLVHRQIL